MKEEFKWDLQRFAEDEEEGKSKEPITKKEAEEMANIVEKIREKAEKYGTESAEFKSYMEKADKDLKELDEKHEALVAQIKEKEKEEKELKERIEHLENLGAIANNQKKEKQDPHFVMNAIFKKNWTGFAEKNPQDADLYMKEMGTVLKALGDDAPSEIKSFQNSVLQYKAANDLLRTDIGELGGYLVQPIWSNTLREQIVEYSAVRRYATVESISGKSIVMPIEQGVPISAYEGEAEEGGSGTPNYTSTTLTPHRLTVTVPITWDMLNNSSYNISQRIMNTARKSFAQKEGEKFIEGDGIKEPLGFTADADVPIYTTETSTLSFNDINSCSGELKRGYNPMWFFNRRTLSYLRNLQDDVGRYLWNPAFGDAASGAPATINGYPYSADMIDMDDYNTATGKPILFADMKEFYTIVDRTDIIVIRDELTQKKKAIIEFTLMTWNHGQPVIKEAGIILQLHA
jgi:HK97 family phage major capsid protein